MSNTVVTLTGDDANLFKAYQRIVAQQAKMDAGLKGVGEQAKKAKTGVDALAASDFDDLNDSLDEISNVKFDFDIGNALVTTASVSKGIELATASWELFSKARDEALRSQEGLSDPNRRLAQIANDAEDLAGMQKRADTAAIATGVPRDVAREVLFSARSENFAQDYEAIIAANQVVDPRSSATVAGQVPALFGNQIQPLESVSLTLAAAKESRLNFEQLATAMPAAAEGASLLGSNPEELAATLAVLASRFKSGDVAADRIKAFGASAGIDERFKGAGILSTLDTLQKMPEDERSDFLGKGQELNVAFEILSQERAKIEQQLAKMQAERAAFAAGGGAIRDQQSIVSADPTANNLRRVASARNQAEIATETNLGKSGADAEVAGALTNTLLQQRKNANILDYLSTKTISTGIDIGNSVFGLGISPETQALTSNLVSEVSNPISMISNFGRSGTADTIRNNSTASQVVEPGLNFTSQVPASNQPQTVPSNNELLQEMKTQNELMRKQNELLERQGNAPATTTPQPPNPALINQQQSLRGQ